MKNLGGRDFISLADFSEEELLYLLDLAKILKGKHRQRKDPALLSGKTLGLIFKKHSTRTKVSFSAAISQLGGHAISLSPEELQLARGETFKDTAKVLSRYLDAIVIRTFEHREVKTWALEAEIPIINGLTDLLHPTQALADFFTLLEVFGGLRGLKLSYMGDGNNMASSLLIGAARLGVHISLACPENRRPPKDVLKLASFIAQETASQIEVVKDPIKAVCNADAIYTDVWTSMGQENDAGKKIDFQNYQVTEEIFGSAKPNAIFLHCLPCHRGEEVSEAVVDGPRSLVFDQAENRLHVNKALLAATILGTPVAVGGL